MSEGSYDRSSSYTPQALAERDNERTVGVSHAEKKREHQYRRNQGGPKRRGRLTSAVLAGSLGILGPAAALWDNSRGDKKAPVAEMASATRQTFLSESPTETRPDDSLLVNFDALGLKGKHRPESKTIIFVQTEKMRTGYEAKDIVPLIKIQKTAEGIVLNDTSPTGMSKEVREWFENIVTPIYPMIDASFNAGGLSEIVIDTQTLVHPDFLITHSQWDKDTKKYI